MHYTIYKTTNKLDGKIYIGKHQTKDLDDVYLGSGKILNRAIKKHGRENFSKEILHVFDNGEEMNDKEAELVSEEFVKEDTNYNLCPGGHGGFGFINQRIMTQEMRSFVASKAGERHKEQWDKGIRTDSQKEWFTEEGFKKRS